MALVVTFNGKRINRPVKTRVGSRGTAGHEQVLTGTIAFDSSYPAGGEPAPAGTSFNDAGVRHVNIFPSGVFRFLYDSVNDKVVAFSTSTGAEVAGAVDLSALTAVQFEVVKRK